MKRILVTGGAGFIGSHLCERLLAEGNEVICLDNFFTGRKENLNGLLDSHRFELVRHDVTEAILLDNTNGISYYFRGNAHNKRNVNDAIGIAYEAIADCTCAINLGITGSYLREAYIERSSAFSTAKCFEAAVSDAQLAIKTDTGHLLTHIRWNLGTYLETLGRYNAAIAAYQDAKHHYKSEGDRSDCDQKITKMQADIEALTKKKEQIQNEFQKVTIQHQNELAAAERGLLKHNLFLLISPNEKC